jgi:hypothetical protein
LFSERDAPALGDAHMALEAFLSLFSRRLAPSLFV